MFKNIKKHIKDKCANYAGNGQCLYDRPCPFFDEKNERARCIYYENAVLPENEQIKADYWRRFGLTYWGWGEKDVKACAVCGKGFTPQSNRQKYCSNCRDEQRRERAKLRKRKQRRNGSK